MKKNNLIQEARWYNPYTAIATNDKAYKIENIIVFSEYGVLLETAKGWFGSNNNLGDVFIGDIYLKRNMMDFSKKTNFLIKHDKKSYRLENNYTLYIYYKNINLKFTGYKITNLFLESNFEMFDGYKEDDVLGFTDRESKKYAYSDELKKACETISTYNFQSNFKEIEKAMQLIKDYHKKYEKAKEQENSYTLKDYKKMCQGLSADCVDSFYIINTIEKTYGVKIDD